MKREKGCYDGVVRAQLTGSVARRPWETPACASSQLTWWSCQRPVYAFVQSARSLLIDHHLQSVIHLFTYF